MFFVSFISIAIYLTHVAGKSLNPLNESRKGVINSRDINTGVTLPLKATFTPGGTILDVDVTVGGQNFSMYLDTGSSDFYLPRTNFQCLNGTDNSILPQESCLFNKAYTISPTFQQINNQSFGVKYGSGIATGILGYETVTIGGLTVERQQIGVADRITDVGDGNDSGVLGLAYPYLTSAHPGTDYPNDTLSLWSNRIPYDPLFTSLHKQGSVKPFFSLAINRTPVNVSNGDGGLLGLGTVVEVPHKPTFAIAPVQIIGVIPPFFTDNVTAKTYWALSVKSTDINHLVSTNNSFQALVDCGNFFNLVPKDVALSINNAFQPPATPNIDFLETGSSTVSCNATAPSFGMSFSNNVTIYIDPRDMLVENADGTCTSAFVDADVLGESTGIVLHILGTPFLRSVVSIWDFGKDEMRFAERIETSGGADPPPNSSVPVVPSSNGANQGSEIYVTCLLFTVLTLVLVL
ncbi:Acid protease [Glarea lozoyensis ATCC 20868]|uniref:Acid protease n=1 Tax=Glarea lozoyensis (strain ATCC 20868 / MF5171) TaxID=1116229 RepID=S3E7X6_GLAL2|nr:Acid protease [Glarea lozoyensis ATCC 20868]EPE34443.1 Acid protease [Glarea lozoyensis ATCC 20868]